METHKKDLHNNGVISRIHQCESCDKRFKYKRHLSYHIKTAHLENTSLYQCDVCTKNFNNKSNLEKHVRTVHENKFKAECSLCKKTYKHTSTFESHMKLQHGNDTVKTNTHSNAT